jgi:hypothetical protein
MHEPKKVALWNKWYFEEKNGECAACLKYSVLIVVENIYKMQHLEGSGTPVLYIGRTVLKGKLCVCGCACARATRGYNNCTLAVYFDFGSQRTSRWRASTPALYSGGAGFKSWPRDRLLWLGDFLVSPPGIFPESASSQDISRVFCMTNHPVVCRCCMLWATEVVVKHLRQNCRIQVQRVTRQRLETLRNPPLFVQ